MDTQICRNPCRSLPIIISLATTSRDNQEYPSNNLDLCQNDTGEAQRHNYMIQNTPCHSTILILGSPVHVAPLAQGPGKGPTTLDLTQFSHAFLQ
jgi:hypothetical protein